MTERNRPQLLNGRLWKKKKTPSGSGESAEKRKDGEMSGQQESYHFLKRAALLPREMRRPAEGDVRERERGGHGGRRGEEGSGGGIKNLGEVEGGRGEKRRKGNQARCGEE